MIRLATKNDLMDICKIHSICFRNSYSSQLFKYQNVIGGGNLLAKFYEEFINDNPELFHVACTDDGSIVGFCMGYYLDNDQQISKFIRNNRRNLIWKTILLLISFNVPTWRKIISRFKVSNHRSSQWRIVNTKFEYICNNKRGDLLSVCVLPEFQGKGYAQRLMDAFLSKMQDIGKELCLLSVETKNLRARKYYERNGFEVYRTRGNSGLTYAKSLTNGLDDVSD